GAEGTMLLYILAVITMSLGNILGLLQDNLKRLLAYSSVAHAGYLLVGLAVAPHLYQGSAIAGVHKTEIGGGGDAVIFYVVAYGAMTIGAFAVLSYLTSPRRPV